MGGFFGEGASLLVTETHSDESATEEGLEVIPSVYSGFSIYPCITDHDTVKQSSACPPPKKKPRSYITCVTPGNQRFRLN